MSEITKISGLGQVKKKITKRVYIQGITIASKNIRFLCSLSDLVSS